MSKITYRRKMIQSGDVIEVEVYPVYAKPSTRAAKHKKSLPAQQALNDKNRLKNLVRMVNSNFQPGTDYFASLTFDDAHLPGSAEEARKIFRKYLARLRRIAKRTGTEFKWLAVMEHDGRYHYHLIVSGITPTDIMERWSSKAEAVPYGIVSISPLVRVDGSFTALARYHGKHGKKKSGERVTGCKSWTCSRNLKKPTVTVSDTAITERKTRELIVQYDEDKLLALLKSSLRGAYRVAEFEGGAVEDYEDWQILERDYQINDISGFYLYTTYVRRTL